MFMKFIIPIVAAGLLTASCQRSASTTPAAYEYTKGYNITLYEPADGQPGFEVRSNTTMDCTNYSVGNTCTVSGNKIELVLDGITAPPTCSSGYDFALSKVPVTRLAVGTYPLAVTCEGNTVTGSMTVSDTSYIVSYPGGNNVTFTKLRQLRVPDHSLWGTIVYDNTLRADTAANQFLDTLRRYGATTYKGLDGSYTNFTVSNSNTFSAAADGSYTRSYRNFIYSYAGSETLVQTLVNNYRRYGDTVHVSVTVNANSYSNHN